MKTHLEWYKTPCGSHNKSEVRVIRSQFGLEGVAQWHILKNTIAGSDNCQINLNVQSNIMSLQADLEMNALELQNFINFLHEVCNIIDYKDNIISSKEISFWLKKVIEKRQRDSENVARKRSENTFKQNQNPSRTTNEKSSATHIFSPTTNEKSSATFNRVEKSRVEESKDTMSRSASAPLDNSVSNKKNEEVLDAKKLKQLKKAHFDKILNFLRDKTGRNFRLINEKTKKTFRTRIKEGYTMEDILNSIENATNLKWHRDNNFQYLTPSFFAQSEKLDKYSTELAETKQIHKPYDNL